MSEQSRSGKSDPEDKKPSASGASDESIGTMVTTQAKSFVGDQVTKRTHKSASDLGTLSKALRLTSEQLEGNLASPYVGKAADHVQRLARFIEDADGPELLRRIESMAQRRPLMFAGAAVLVGFGGARFLKSSSRHGHANGDGTSGGRTSS